MAELDQATGDSGNKKQQGLKRKVALPLLLVIGVVAGALIYFISRRQSGASGAAQAAQTGLPYAVPSAQSPSNDNSISGLQALIGNLGQQMDANFAALQQQTTSTPAPTTTPPPSYTVLTANPDFVPPKGVGWEQTPGMLPIYGHTKPGTGGIQWIPQSSALQVTGPLTQSGIPVNYLGQQFMADPTEWSLGTSSQHPATYLSMSGPTASA